MQTRIEVSDGFRRLARYLDAWAGFAAWLEARGLDASY
jgi:hypothetical protein